MKKVFVGVLLLLILAGGVLVYIELKPKTVIGGSNLSERSKRFISSQKSKNEILRDTDFSDSKNSSGPNSKIEIKGCFSFVMPFTVRFAREDKKCEVTYGTDLPRGTLIMYKRSGSITSFDSVPGVTLRRQESGKYKEELKTIAGRTFLLFSQTEEEQIINAFYFEPDFYFVVNFVGSTSETTKAKLLKLLQTVEFY